MAENHGPSQVPGEQADSAKADAGETAKPKGNRGARVAVGILVFLVLAFVAVGLAVRRHQPVYRAEATQGEPGPTEKWLVYKDWPFDPAEAARRQRATAEALGVKVEQEVDLGGGVKLTLVLIPAGKFQMGSAPEEKDRVGESEKLHPVTVSRSFWIGKYEVTQEEWEAVMGGHPGQDQDKGPKYPVNSVSWNEVQGFLQRLNGKVKGGGFALPTEAQWEYACRAGTSARFCSGDDDGALGDYAWFGDNSKGTTHPVGQKRPNAWGVHDMLGNVWEWCASPHSGTYDGNELKGAEADARVRVLRGGSWGNNPRGCRSANRLGYAPEARFDYFGFRVIRSARTSE